MKFKKFIIAIITIMCVAAFTLSACTLGNTSNVTVVNYTPTDEQWAEYLETLSSADTTSLQEQNVQKSLLSGVTIIVEHAYTKAYSNSGIMYGGSVYYYEYHGFALGSGVIVELDTATDEAYIVTNCHVVMSDTASDVFPEADSISIFFYGQDTEGVNYNLNEKETTVKATSLSGAAKDVTITDLVLDDGGYSVSGEVVAASQSYDIALIKASASEILTLHPNAQAAEFAESDDVYIGQSVYTVGNPQWEGMSASSGVVAKDSEIVYLSLSDDETSTDYNEYRVIRTDAVINGGNSGGALYNSSGKIIGIVNCKTEEDGVENMGYAIPGSVVKRLWQLMKEGSYNVTLGSSSGVITSGVQRAVLPFDYEVVYTGNTVSSGYVSAYESVALSSSYGSLKAGDVITNIRITDASGAEVENRAVTRTYHIDDTLLSVRSGYKVYITVNNGTEEEVTCSFSTYS